MSMRTARLAAAALVALTLGAGGLTLVGAAGAASKPTINVTPIKNLKNGQEVTVWGSGFTPGDSLYIVECKVNATGEAGCDLTNLTPVTVSSSGTFPKTKFKVAAGRLKTAGSSIACGINKATASNCQVSVGNAEGTDSATKTVTFVIPKAKK